MSDSNTTETKRQERPAAVVKEKFWLEYGTIRVQLGVSPTTGTLCAYQYQEKQGNGWTPAVSFGQFPVSNYGNRWEILAKVAPACAAFVVQDRASETPQLSSKKKADVKTGETVTIDAPSAIVSAIMAQKGVERTEAERIAKASGFLK